MRSYSLTVCRSDLTNEHLLVRKVCSSPQIPQLTVNFVGHVKVNIPGCTGGTRLGGNVKGSENALLAFFSFALSLLDGILNVVGLGSE